MNKDQEAVAKIIKKHSEIAHYTLVKIGKVDVWKKKENRFFIKDLADHYEKEDICIDCKLNKEEHRFLKKLGCEEFKPSFNKKQFLKIARGEKCLIYQ